MSSTMSSKCCFDGFLVVWCRGFDGSCELGGGFGLDGVGGTRGSATICAGVDGTGAGTIIGAGDDITGAGDDG